MKKFKKPLLINVPQDDHHQAKSPSRATTKQSKQKSLLLFNQNTISSSANNQDDMHEQDDKAVSNCEQFIEFSSKRQYERKTGQSGKQQQQEANKKLGRHKKFNIIQFQQFMVEKNNDKISKNTEFQGNNDGQQRGGMLRNYHKKQFSIQIPEQQQKYEKQEQSQEMSIKFAFDLKNNEHPDTKTRQNMMMKQPPAPSNKSGKTTLNRRFVFPTNDQQTLYQQGSFSNHSDHIANNNKQKTKSQKSQMNANSITFQEHERIVKQIQEEFKQKTEQLTKSFQKERQEFYKQKSRLQKDLMIKDGQIEMLQRLITNRYSPTNNNQQQAINNNYGDNSVDTFVNKHNTRKDSSLSQSISVDRSKILYVSDEKVTAMQTLILEKDLQINSLLQKINDLNAVIDRKNHQLQEVKVTLLKNENMNQSLRNQIFIHEKKQQSQKLTKQFYKAKQTLIQVQKSINTPKAGYSRPKWEEDKSLQKDKDYEKSDYPFRGIDDLHKRLESLKMNRIQLENRGRIKSEINYPQTSKNKTKGMFDFKGKFYDREKDYNLRNPY